MASEPTSSGTPLSTEEMTDPITSSEGQTSPKTSDVTSLPSEPTSSPSPESTATKTDESTTSQISPQSTDPCGSTGDCFETVSKPATTEEPTTSIPEV